MYKICFFLLLIPIFPLSQIKTKMVYNDLQRMNLKGKVKEVLETDFKIENNVTVETKKKEFHEFFSNGKLKKKENFSSQNISIFAYDDKERISSQNTENSNIKYSYPKDSVVNITTNNGNFTYTSKSVFKKNQEIEIKKVLNKTESKAIYNYDKKNRITKSLELHYSPNQVDTIRISSSYYKKCLMPIMQSFEKPFFKNILNNRCDIITHISLKNDGTIHQKHEYTYVYDKRKNWIERKTYSEGTLIKSTIRQIVYY